MASIIQHQEGTPEAYPNAPSGLSTAAAALNKDVVWRRLEQWTWCRFGARSVLFVAIGPGEFRSPVMPVDEWTTEIWENGSWQSVTLDASAVGGFILPCEATYRFTASAGADNSPNETFLEAYRRLAEYLAADKGTAGVTSESLSAGSISMQRRRSESWAARAMQNSGAADLLRGYRRV